MKSPERPIGIFDSGVGGLTVARALVDMFPSESFIYFGDTAHLPYGEKSSESILHFSRGITSFLLEYRCKAIVIACNSASSVAYETLRKLYPDLIIVNVIDPIVEHIAMNPGFRRIAVIGTRATIRSGLYTQKIKERCAHCEVHARATPLLAPLVEEGFYNTALSREAIKLYLDLPEYRQLDALVLACTHYPLLFDDIRTLMPDKTAILDTPKLVAAHLKELLRAKGMECPPEGEKEIRFFVSDFTDTFERTAQVFFSAGIRLEEKNIWKS